MKADGSTCLTENLTRRARIEVLHLEAEAQKANLGKRHVSKNSLNVNSKAPMQGVYENRGLASDTSTHAGSTSCSINVRARLEKEAIGRILSRKPH